MPRDGNSSSAMASELNTFLKSVFSGPSVSEISFLIPVVNCHFGEALTTHSASEMVS